jgi:predicted transposase/invertase (TIGR01784 family)
MTKLVRFDWAIKYLLRNKANFDILEGFLSELLKIPVLIENILESEGNKNHSEDKFNRVDLLVKTQQGQHIIVEVQCSRQWDYLSRILYGTSKMVCEYLREGDEYQKICKVISVSIVFFDLGTGKDYLYKGNTIFKGMHFNDTLNLNAKECEVYHQLHIQEPQTPSTIFPEYYIIKVPEFHEKIHNKFDEWVYFLKHGEIKQDFNAQGIQSAAKKLDTLKLSIEDQHAYKKYQDGLHDDASFNRMLDITRAEGHAEGHAKGHAKGQYEERYQIAKSLKKAGLSAQEIATHTHLSIEEINQIEE